MNRKSKLFREVRQMQRPKLLMDFSDYDSLTSCQCCNVVVNAYTYIPVLGNMYVCDKHKYKWDRWGLPLFKEVIGFE